MKVSAILEGLEGLGVTVTVKGDTLRLEPGSRVPLELVEELRAHKQEIILCLSGYPLKYAGDVRAGPEELAEIVDSVNAQGYVLLWSTVLRDLVAFALDETARAKIPPGFVAYTLAELEELFGDGKVAPSTLRLIHQAKRLAGGRIVGKGKQTGGDR